MSKQKKLIGEILVSLGYVSVEHINEARRHQMQANGKKIGECLVELGYVEEDDIRRALSLQDLD
jgi:K+ transporter